ncbi:MAG: hypothetical protein JWN38_269 [Candidatus Saccharibacteria bacterium]|nr:hypothetical protein [Candidatus Saccharibacteria bacterium]
MPAKIATNPVDHVVPLNINHLEGRMLKLPAPKRRNREILLLYGSHSNLERMFSLAEELNKYGAVTMPDLPGFGGMDSLYKIGKKPTIESQADYLASFVKMQYRRRRFTIIGLSYGFLVATRMLQKYPELAARVDFAVSLVGFAHKDDFRIAPNRKWLIRNGTGLFRLRPLSFMATVLFRGPVITLTYKALAGRHAKMKDADPEELRKRIAFEKILWTTNDFRTYFYHTHEMFMVDLCTAQTKVPVYHVAVGNDQYFDNKLVEQHLAIIYSSVTMLSVSMKAHMPTIIATAAEIAPLIPQKLRKALSARP